MKICNSCKTMNQDSDAVCKKCGEVLPVSSEWQAQLRQHVQSTDTTPRPEVHKPAPSKSPTPQAPSAAWSPALASAGLLLVCGFIVAEHNAGLALALGGALSVAALSRGVSEHHEPATITATLSVIVFIISTIFRLMAK